MKHTDLLTIIFLTLMENYNAQCYSGTLQKQKKSEIIFCCKIKFEISDMSISCYEFAMKLWLTKNKYSYTRPNILLINTTIKQANLFHNQFFIKALSSNVNT